MIDSACAIFSSRSASAASVGDTLDRVNPQVRFRLLERDEAHAVASDGRNAHRAPAKS